VCVGPILCVCCIHINIHTYINIHIYIHIYADCRPDAGACSVLEYLQGHQPGYGTCSDDLAPVVFIRACEHPK
jgi:hypothetical protein